MNIIVCHTKRYGGITSFLINVLKNYNFSNEDILLLDKNIQTNLLLKIRDITNCKIAFLTEVGVHTVIKRWFQTIQIFKLRQKNNVDRIIYIDWNLILDGLSMLIPIEQIDFVHTYPTKKLPVFMKPFINKIICKSSIVTVSKSSKKIIKENWLINPKKISVLYNYSSLPGNTKIHDLDYDNINIVTIAHCEIYKNPELWLKTAKLVTNINKNIKFHWYGDGTLYDKYSKETYDETNIFFHGYTEKVDEILREQADIYFQCSKMESLGISILDAMNYSLPTIVANNGGMPELVVNESTGFIGVTEQDFCKAILYIASDNRIHKSFSECANKLYNDNFSEKIWVEGLISILG